MTEGDVLLRDIIGSPDDDGLRLIYADWLEDNGQPVRAEFIRVQVQLARAEIAAWRNAPVIAYAAGGEFVCSPGEYPHQLQTGDHIFSRRGDGMFRPNPVRGIHVGGVGEGTVISYGPAEDARKAYQGFADREREASLWVKHRGGGIVPAWLSLSLAGRHSPDLNTVSRGFIDTVFCPFDKWLERGEEVASAHPLRGVRFTDKKPRQLGDLWGWYPCEIMHDEAQICWPVADLLSDHGCRTHFEGDYVIWYVADDEAAAVEALSRASLAHARRLTQLPASAV